jgi:glycosyltransferase involved in cell wall biosynthesis
MAAVTETHKDHVGLNAHLLSLEENYRGAGINWYIYNLLYRLPDAGPELRYTAYLHEPRFAPRQGMDVARPGWSTATPWRRIAWEQLVAPSVLRRDRVDLLHAMAFVSPLMSPCPTVVTVLDLGFLYYPEAIKRGRRLYLQWMTHLSVRRARRVIAISANTRRDIIARFRVAPERVETVYCGVDRRFQPLPAQDVAAFRQQKGLPERYILFLGTIEPRKNVTSLLSAYAQLVERAPVETSGLALVIAGAKGWFYRDVFTQVEALGLAQRVHFPGYVPEAEKPMWYNAATCFCYPSLYEGFGLPPLEAMACGVPVITSDTSSLPEVAGDAARMVPPLDVDALCTALHELVTKPSLRAELAQRGRRQAQRFSWEQAARQTVQIYHLAMEAG